MGSKLIDLSEMAGTLRNAVSALVGIDTTIFGTLRNWSDLRVAVVGIFVTFVCIVLFTHIRPLKEASIKVLLWLNGALTVIAFALIGVKWDWWDTSVLGQPLPSNAVGPESPLEKFEPTTISKALMI